MANGQEKKGKVDAVFRSRTVNTAARDTGAQNIRFPSSFLFLVPLYFFALTCKFCDAWRPRQSIFYNPSLKMRLRRSKRTPGVCLTTTCRTTCCFSGVFRPHRAHITFRLNANRVAWPEGMAGRRGQKKRRKTWIVAHIQSKALQSEAVLQVKWAERGAQSEPAWSRCFCGAVASTRKKPAVLGFFSWSRDAR